MENCLRNAGLGRHGWEKRQGLCLEEERAHFLPAAGHCPAGAGGQAVGSRGPCQGGRAGGWHAALAAAPNPWCQWAGQPGPALPGPHYQLDVWAESKLL